jgi:hypothetical protein
MLENVIIYDYSYKKTKVHSEIIRVRTAWAGFP